MSGPHVGRKDVRSDSVCYGGVTSTPNSSAKHSLVRRFDRLLYGDISLNVLLSWWGLEHVAP